MGKMSPRERVLAAVAHKEPDRVPINFGGEICTCIVESEPDGRIYTRLCQALDIWDRPPPTTSEFLNIVVNIDVRVQDALHSDMTSFFCQIPPARVEEDGTKTWDKFLGIRIKRMGYYDEFFDFPMRNMTEPREIKDYPYWPDTKDPYYTDGVRDAAKKLRESTDRTITGASTFSALPFNFYPFLTARFARDAEGAEVIKQLFSVERTENKITKPTDNIIAQTMFSIIGKALKTKIFADILKVDISIGKAI